MTDLDGTVPRLTSIIDRWQGLRVLVVGDLILDQYVLGVVSRISPEAPVPVLTVLGERFGLGGAANVAANVTGLGGRCRLVGVVGRGAPTDQFLLGVEEFGIEPDGLVMDPDRQMTVKTRLVSGHYQVYRFDHESDFPIEGVVADAIIRQTQLRGYDAVIIQDYDKGVLTPDVIRATMNNADEAGVPVVVDPKSRNFWLYRDATVFKPNAGELEAALGEPIKHHTASWMESVRERCKCDTLMVTLGGVGMAICTEGGDLVQIRTGTRRVFDVSGAGDTVAAVVALALAAGADIEDAGRLGNIAAGIAVQEPGAVPVHVDKLRRAL